MQKSHSNCFKMASFDRIKFRISHVPVVFPPGNWNLIPYASVTFIVYSLSPGVSSF